MERRIFLGLVLHNHQPVGNFTWIFEEAYEQAYLPMVEALERHPGVRLGLHYTGPLLDWLRERHPDFIRRVGGLVARNQVEILTGAYYEPILPAIPDADKLGQIRYMTRVVADEFGYQPSGMWLAERVWEPQLPKFLAEAGVRWTVLDDSHFKAVGLKDEDLFGYYVTEDQGYPVKLFGTSQQLRYSIPWLAPEEVIAYLRQEAVAGGARVAVMGDDGEKFGVWPGTFDLCWRRGWIDRLFRLIEQNAAWLITVPLSEYAQAYPAIGRTYLPTASYAEMMEWALPADAASEFSRLVHELKAQNRGDVLRYLRGGFWRYFLAKYPEVNTMHKKMLLVHDKVYRAGAADPDGETGLRDLWRGQCNCPYWHGVFGGIYLTDVRAATFASLLRAEEAADRRLDAGRRRQWRLTDFDCDSHDELLVETGDQNLYFDLVDGGSLFEWDFRPKCFNLTATLSRRPEAYHQVLKESKGERVEPPKGGFSGPAGETGEEEAVNIHDLVRVKEAGLAERIAYDWYRRSCLIDHFLYPETSLADFRRMAYGEMGDFVNNGYRSAVREADGGLEVELRRDGHLWSDGRLLPFQVEKRLRIGDRTLAVVYHLTNTSEATVRAVFASEWNLNLLGGGGNPAASYRFPGSPEREERLDATGEDDLAALVLGNRLLGVELRLTLDRPTRLWRLPIETISNSEAGFERVYQGSTILPQWPIDLAPGQSWAVELRWEVGEAS